MAITKLEIVEEINRKVGLPKSQSVEIVETFLETIKQILERGEKVKLSGFGNFVPRDKRQRIGRNPKTGERMPISSRRVVTFKASPILKEKLNSNQD